MFLKEYYDVMKPVSQALNLLQRKAKAFIDLLLPTVAVCLKKLQKLNEIIIGHILIMPYAFPSKVC